MPRVCMYDTVRAQELPPQKGLVCAFLTLQMMRVVNLIKALWQLTYSWEQFRNSDYNIQNVRWLKIKNIPKLQLDSNIEKASMLLNCCTIEDSVRESDKALFNAILDSLSLNNLCDLFFRKIETPSSARALILEKALKKGSGNPIDLTLLLGNDAERSMKLLQSFTPSERISLAGRVKRCFKPDNKLHQELFRLCIEDINADTIFESIDKCFDALMQQPTAYEKILRLLKSEGEKKFRRAFVFGFYALPIEAQKSNFDLIPRDSFIRLHLIENAKKYYVEAGRPLPPLLQSHLFKLSHQIAGQVVMLRVVQGLFGRG